ncbi:ABC transporter permease [Jatrophihabitans cynanchi]|uniref:ABC transporter permease n=1 Tax=Jatrophihabitans cynanchi TaxID=2944128 RepID=A0ABY7K6Q4_9ACTN|nr:ABC transporter permease [Jatrophihabitans sp. SB3-54]WAX58994.1 ABC transporter permease [Jatrophihabitans sp. SB3-54]
MAHYVARRLGITVVLGFGITIISFLLTNVIPVDPAVANLGDIASGDPAVVAAFRAKYGLDKPLLVQYFRYLDKLVHGDLGTSHQTGRPVRTDLLQYAPATIELVMVAIAFAAIFGIGLGTVAALCRNRWPDQLARVVSLIGVSTPVFWLGLVVSYVMFAKLHLLPGSGRIDPRIGAPTKHTGFLLLDSLVDGNLRAFGSAVEHIILPAAVLATYTLGILIKFSRAAVLEVIGTDYVRSARGKGLPGLYVIWRYILRAAAGPIVTVTGVAFGTLLSGTVLVESVFSWPGLGQYAYRAATSNDLSAVMGVSLLVSLTYIVVNLLVDLAYMALDPRMRLT